MGGQATKAGYESLRGGGLPPSGRQGTGWSPQVFPSSRPPFPGAQPRTEEVSKDLLDMLHFSRSQEWNCGQILGVS